MTKEIIRLINSAKKIGLITHKDGDGDGFGSMLGLERILQCLGKDTQIFSNEDLIPQFDFLRKNIKYQPVDTYLPVDILIGTDANSIERFTIPQLFDDAKKDKAKIIIIDHHLQSDIGDKVDVYWHSEKTSCASEMVYELSKKMDVKIDKITANIILMGIETDTFSMQFSNTAPKTYETVADLIRMGARLRPIIESAFGGKPISVVKLLGLAIERLKLNRETGLGVTYLTQKDISNLGLKSEASSGVANFLDQVDKLKLTAVFEERENGKIKVSLRSNNSDINVARIAGNFGGGGHEKAAGYEFNGSLDDAIQEFKKIWQKIT